MYTSHYRLPRLIGAQTLFLAFIRRYCRVRVEGLDQVPRTGAFILAANHASHVDTAVIYAVLPRALRKRVVAAAARDYFFTNRVRRYVSRALFNAIPVERSGVARPVPLRHVARALREGYGVLLYPEGTRAISGEIGPFRSGIGRLVAEFPTVPVVPVVLIGTDVVMPKKALLPLPHPVCVRFGAPLRTLHASLADRSTWRAAAEEVRAAVVRLKDQPAAA